MDQTLQGKRCRTVRPIMHHVGFIPRESSGTVRYTMSNIGRCLVRIDLDSGPGLLLLAEDVVIDTGEPHRTLGS